MNNPFRSITLKEMAYALPAGASLRSAFSPEIETQRRRKGSGPKGRASTPVFRRESGGGTGGSSSGSGGFQSFPGGSSGGGLRISPWIVIAVLVLVVVCGGGSMLGDLLGIFGGDGSTPDQQVLNGNDTNDQGSNNPPVVGFTPPVGSQPGSWTVMLYQDADDKILEKDVFMDFNEAERIGSSDMVNIVAQIDRYQGAFSGDGNWTSARRYYLTPDHDLNSINSQLAVDLGEVNMADPNTLVDFVTWSIATFPADHYVLILSDHGMGWPGGWSDPTTKGSTQTAPIVNVIGRAVYVDELDDALAQIVQQTGIGKFDIIGLDACLMGQIEVMSALEPYTSYAITSQETEPALGWAYTAFLQALTDNPGMSAADLSKLVVQSYISSDLRIVDDQARADFLNDMGGSFATASQLNQVISKKSTLAAVDLSRLPDLVSSLNDLAYQMQAEDQSIIAKARSYALSFTSIFGSSVPPAYIDLGSFVQILGQSSRDANIQQLSANVLANIRQAVFAEKHGSSLNGASGVAIYFPTSKLYASPYSGPQSYTLVADRFSQDSLWDDFLAFHYNGRDFDPDTRQAVIPSSDLPSRVPGLGQFTVSPLRLSSDTAEPGVPVTMRSDISGDNIGNIFLFVGYYDQGSNAIYVADTDFLESPDTQQVDGVYYPEWGASGAFTVKFDWDPILFTLSDGQNEAVALFTPQQYGASAADAIYSVDGIYTLAVDGSSLNARLNFQDGVLVSIFGITGQDDIGAPREILPQVGDSFVILDKWLELDSQGQVQDTTFQAGDTTFYFSGQSFTWQETYAPAGNYILGFLVTDLDGNSVEVYDQVEVR